MVLAEMYTVDVLVRSKFVNYHLVFLGPTSMSKESSDLCSGDFPLIANNSAWASKKVLLPSLDARP